MRKQIKIPRIIKIEKVDHLTIQCMFNNGESRLLDFKKIFTDWNISEEEPEYKLLSKNAFNKVELRNFTLSWSNVVIEIENEAGEIMKLPYEIGPDVLYELSQEIDSDETKFGSLIKSARLKSGLTQEQLVL